MVAQVMRCLSIVAVAARVLALQSPWKAGSFLAYLNNERYFTIVFFHRRCFVFCPMEEKLGNKGDVVPSLISVILLPPLSGSFYISPFAGRFVVPAATAPDLACPAAIVVLLSRRPFRLPVGHVLPPTYVHAFTRTNARFQRIETLPGLPEEETARKILESLAADPGIRAVLEKHQWTVGALCELYPEGKVCCFVCPGSCLLLVHIGGKCCVLLLYGSRRTCRPAVFCCWWWCGWRLCVQVSIRALFAKRVFPASYVFRRAHT